MALIKCPECGHDISDRAASCPYCGISREDIYRIHTAQVERQYGYSNKYNGKNTEILFYPTIAKLTYGEAAAYQGRKAEKGNKNDSVGWKDHEMHAEVQKTTQSANWVVKGNSVANRKPINLSWVMNVLLILDIVYVVCYIVDDLTWRKKISFPFAKEFIIWVGGLYTILFLIMIVVTLYLAGKNILYPAKGTEGYVAKIVGVIITYSIVLFANIMYMSLPVVMLIDFSFVVGLLSISNKIYGIKQKRKDVIKEVLLFATVGILYVYDILVLV